MLWNSLLALGQGNNTNVVELVFGPWSAPYRSLKLIIISQNLSTAANGTDDGYDRSVIWLGPGSTHSPCCLLTPTHSLTDYKQYKQTNKQTNKPIGSSG